MGRVHGSALAGQRVPRVWALLPPLIPAAFLGAQSQRQAAADRLGGPKQSEKAPSAPPQPQWFQSSTWEQGHDGERGGGEDFPKGKLEKSSWAQRSWEFCYWMFWGSQGECPVPLCITAFPPLSIAPMTGRAGIPQPGCFLHCSRVTPILVQELLLAWTPREGNGGICRTLHTTDCSSSLSQHP